MILRKLASKLRVSFIECSCLLWSYEFAGLLRERGREIGYGVTILNTSFRRSDHLPASDWDRVGRLQEVTDPRGDKKGVIVNGIHLSTARKSAPHHELRHERKQRPPAMMVLFTQHHTQEATDGKYRRGAGTHQG